MTPANRFRPFCSERCQMVDLGKWAGEDYRVAGGAVEDREHPDDLKKKLLTTRSSTRSSTKSSN